MPLKRTYSTTTSIVPAGMAKKKRAAPKRRKPMLIVGQPRPFPTRMLATLKYCDTIALDSSLVSTLSKFMSCNSIYDPNRSDSGHQPYGHDTYATIYNQYTVVKSKCTFSFLQIQAVLAGFTWGGGISDDTSTPLAYDTWAERPSYKVRPMFQNAGPLATPLTLYWDRDKRFPSPDTAQSLSANFGSNPAEEEFFELVVQNAINGTLGKVYLFVQIEYTVEMYEPKDLGSS